MHSWGHAGVAAGRHAPVNALECLKVLKADAKCASCITLVI